METRLKGPYIKEGQFRDISKQGADSKIWVAGSNYHLLGLLFILSLSDQNILGEILFSFAYIVVDLLFFHTSKQ